MIQTESAAASRLECDAKRVLCATASVRRWPLPVRGGKGVFGADEGLFRAATEVVSQENPVVGRPVVPNEVSFLCQAGVEFPVESLGVSDVDQTRCHGRSILWHTCWRSS
jgi:hypothetical protein